MAQISVRTWSGGLKNQIIRTKSEFLAALQSSYFCKYNTVDLIFLTVLYFSDLETHQNLTAIYFGEKDNTHNIQYIIFTSLCANILVLISRLQISQNKRTATQMGFTVNTSKLFYALP